MSSFLGNWYLPKHAIIKSYDQAVEGVRKGFLKSRMNSELKFTLDVLRDFNDYTFTVRYIIHQRYHFPLRPMFKRIFDQFWNENYFLVGASHVNAEIHNTATEMIEKVLRQLGEEHGLLDVSETRESECGV